MKPWQALSSCSKNAGECAFPAKNRLSLRVTKQDAGHASNSKNSRGVSLENTERYNMRNIIILWIVFLFSLTAYSSIANAKRAQYIGNLGCKCHKPNQEDWASSPHGKAFESLLLKGRAKQQKKALRKAGLDYKKDYSKKEIDYFSIFFFRYKF